jgi:hypothetical protein
MHLGKYNIHGVAIMPMESLNLLWGARTHVRFAEHQLKDIIQDKNATLSGPLKM